MNPESRQFRATRRQRRRAAGFIATIAALLFVISPIVRPVPAGATAIVEICTAHGIVSVPLPDGGDPAPGSGMPKCPVCGLGAFGKTMPKSFGAPAFDLPPPIAAATAAAPCPDTNRPATRTCDRVPPPRAPPVPV